MTKRRIIHQQIFFVLTMALFFVFPIYKKLTPIIVVLMILNWFAEGHFRSKFSALFSDNWTFPTMFILAILFYGFHLIAELYTENTADPHYELERKLSFLAYPFILLPIHSFRFKKDKGKWLLLAFLGGVLISSMYCFIQAGIKYMATGDVSMMYYVNFSILEHPTYYAMYMITAVLIIVNLLYREWENIKNYHRYILIAMIPWFILMVMLSNSRAAILAMGLVFLFLMIYMIFKTKRYIIGTVMLVLMIATGFSTKYLMPHVFDRFNMGIGEVLHARSMDDIEHWNGTTLRVQVYYCSLELAEENFWVGVGPGDVSDELMAKYKLYKFRHAVERGYNAHNQFLQVFIGLGLIGFLIFMAIFIVPFIYAIRQGDFIQMAFIIMLLILFMFESMLQQQAGIMFILFTLMFFHSRERIMSKSEAQPNVHTNES